MSETIEQEVIEQPIVPEAKPPTGAQQVANEIQPNVGQEGGDQPSTETPEQLTKPDRTERRIANLTRKMGEESRAREAAERRAIAAEVLLQAKEAPEGKSNSSPVDVEARATQIATEREFNRRLSEIDATGKKNMGADAWEQTKATMTGLGAAANTPFLQALAETDNPDKIFAHFADDTDALMDLLGKSPAAMAAKLGRLDAEMSKPVARPLSAAPNPPPKPQRAAVAPEPNPLDYPATMSMREWNKMMDAHLPPSLGGKKKVA